MSGGFTEFERNASSLLKMKNRKRVAVPPIWRGKMPSEIIGGQHES